MRRAGGTVKVDPMSEQIPLDQMIAEIATQLRAKLGVRGKDLGTALGKARHRLPRRIYRQALILVRAQPLAGHPKLRLTLDGPALESAAAEVSAHLEAIDLADRRKGWWLGMLGGLSFNLILMAVALVGFLIWRGIL